MIESQPVINADDAKITKSYLVWLQFEDGCELKLAGPNDRSEGYGISLPGGLTVRCPHGLTVSYVYPIDIGLPADSGKGA